MSHVVVADLAYSLPDGRLLFSDLSFKISGRERAAIVGPNGAGKSTLLRIVAGLMTPDAGDVGVDGALLHMAQDIGHERDATTVREMLLTATADPLRGVGQRLAMLARDAETDLDAGVALGDGYADWADLGGYQLEALWDRAAREVLGRGLSEVEQLPAHSLSGGERKQLVLSVLFAGDADVLLLDEPDNFLDVPAKQWLERLLLDSAKTVLLVSHDRHLLTTAATKIVTIEGRGGWTHPSSYADYEEARERRQEALGDELRRWQEEERRLYRHFRLMKQRAAVNYKNAPKANAAETRWRRFAEAGPPDPPVRRRHIRTRLIGADSARRVVVCDAVTIRDLVAPFDLEVMFGERVALVGPNGSGKTHLLRVLAACEEPSTGRVQLGSRVCAGYFTQTGDRPDLADVTLLEAVTAITGDAGRARSALARYGLQPNVSQRFPTLSGGEKARFEVLLLEQSGSNLLLLDEPTDNLDLDSSTALEAALDEFVGTVIAVSHDRAFLASFDRFVVLDADGVMYESPSYETTMAVLVGADEADGRPRVRSLTRR